MNYSTLQPDLITTNSILYPDVILCTDMYRSDKYVDATKPYESYKTVKERKDK